VKRLSDFFYSISKGWIALAALLIFILFSALTLPGQSAVAENYSQGSGSPDTSFFYIGSDLYTMAGLYGDRGRAAYVRARWTFDLVFPFVYTFFLVTAISWALNKILPSSSGWRLLNLVPIAAFLFDFLENTMTTLVMSKYPTHCPPAELLAMVFTPLKWLMVGSSFIILLFGIVFLVKKGIYKDRR